MNSDTLVAMYVPAFGNTIQNVDTPNCMIWTLNVAAPARMVVVGTNVYESSDSGANFSVLSPVGLAGPVAPCPSTPSASAVAYGHPSNVNVLYVGTHSGDLWLRTAAYPSPLVKVESYRSAGASAANGLALDANDWQRVYVVDSNNQIWRTTNAGGAWANVSANLGLLISDMRTVAVASRSATPGDVAVLVGGLGGVCYATDTPSAGGLKWTRLDTLPNTIFSDVHYDATDDVVVSTLFKGFPC